MERGDRVRIRTGAWVDHTGALVFVDHEAGQVTVALDEGPTHMIRTSMNNIEMLPCKRDLTVV